MKGLIVAVGAVLVSQLAFAADVVSTCPIERAANPLQPIIDATSGWSAGIPANVDDYVSIHVPVYRLDCHDDNGCPAKYAYHQFDYKVERTNGGDITLNGVKVNPDGTFVIITKDKFQDPRDSTMVEMSGEVHGHIVGRTVIIDSSKTVEANTADYPAPFGGTQHVVIRSQTDESTGSAYDTF